LVQTRENRWDFHYVADHTAGEHVAEAIARVLGDDVRVVAFRRRFIAPAASGKFALLKPLPRAV
jgi:phenylacetate-CoA ligase